MPKSLISIHDFTKEEMLHVLDVAQEFEMKCILMGRLRICRLRQH